LQTIVFATPLNPKLTANCLMPIINLSNNTMGFPAARTTDMHTCPMQTPVVFGTIPHVGGPILIGVPNVLIGTLPAAVIDYILK
jgi:hypothetical protein